MMTILKTYSSLTLWFFHIIGAIAIISFPDTAKLTPFILFISAILLLINEYRLMQRPLVFIIIFVGGFIIEAVGVNTGYLFGAYSYGEVLGPKVLGVPIIIGLNWIITIMASTALSQRMFRGVKIPLLALFAAVFATLLDFLIEPVAIKLDFWNWSNSIIPIFNYICWLIFSFLFALLYIQSGSKLNKVGIHLYIIWILFFTTLIFAL